MTQSLDLRHTEPPLQQLQLLPGRLLLPGIRPFNPQRSQLPSREAAATLEVGLRRLSALTLLPVLLPVLLLRPRRPLTLLVLPVLLLHPRRPLPDPLQLVLLQHTTNAEVNSVK